MITFLPDDERVMPPTVPHDVIAGHPLACMCYACRDYRAFDVQLLRRLRQTRRVSSRTVVSS